jgi:hypothetical protein
MYFRIDLLNENKYICCDNEIICPKNLYRIDPKMNDCRYLDLFLDVKYVFPS